MKLVLFALSCLFLFPLSVLSGGSESRWSNAKRLARGLSPLPPQRLYNPNVARQAQPSVTSSVSQSSSATASSASSASSRSSSIAAVPTAAGVHAVVVDSVSGTESKRRRQTIGSGASAGNLNQVAQLTPAASTRFSLTLDDEVAVGLYPTDYQQPTAAHPITEFICLSNSHSVDQTRTEPITLSPDLGAYVQLGDCDWSLDQPAGSPPVNNPSSVEPQYYAETRVWQVDPSTGLISWHYVNPDGSVSPNQVAVTFSCPDFGTPTSTWVFVTSNVQMFREAFANTLIPGSVVDPNACSANVLNMFYTTS